jgi:putative acetyltransferase
MHIRQVRPDDLATIHTLHLAAFGDEGQSVADLALALMADATAQPLLALVAEENQTVIGCVIFSSVSIQGTGDHCAYILAPLAVAPHRQGAGIGSQLIQTGLHRLHERGADLLFVLGNPRYYSRFGFSHRHKVRAPHPPPYPEAWMVLTLQGSLHSEPEGRLTCARSLEQPEHW